MPLRIGAATTIHKSLGRTLPAGVCGPPFDDCEDDCLCVCQPMCKSLQTHHATCHVSHCQDVKGTPMMGVSVSIQTSTRVVFARIPNAYLMSRAKWQGV
jgi:hypothetical protein